MSSGGWSCVCLVVCVFVRCVHWSLLDVCVCVGGGGGEGEGVCICVGGWVGLGVGVHAHMYVYYAGIVCVGDRLDLLWV